MIPKTKGVKKCPKCEQALKKLPKGMGWFEFLQEHQNSGCKKFVRIKKSRCKMKRCKTLPKFICDGCQHKYCARHRWADVHACKPVCARVFRKKNWEEQEY